MFAESTEGGPEVGLVVFDFYKLFHRAVEPVEYCVFLDQFKLAAFLALAVEVHLYHGRLVAAGLDYVVLVPHLAVYLYHMRCLYGEHRHLGAFVAYEELRRAGAVDRHVESVGRSVQRHIVFLARLHGFVVRTGVENYQAVAVFGRFPECRLAQFDACRVVFLVFGEYGVEYHLAVACRRLASVLVQQGGFVKRLVGRFTVGYGSVVFLFIDKCIVQVYAVAVAACFLYLAEALEQDVERSGNLDLGRRFLMAQRLGLVGIDDRFHEVYADIVDGIVGAVRALAVVVKLYLVVVDS